MEGGGQKRLTTYLKNFVNQDKKHAKNKMEIFQISKLENPIAMGIGTQPNFIDALPNNHGLTLPNKKWRGQLAFQ